MKEAERHTQASIFEAKNSRKWVITGMVGFGIAALCCFTPILVGSLVFLGLGAVTGYLDFVLLPAMAFFLCLLAYGLIKQRSGEAGLLL